MVLRDSNQEKEFEIFIISSDLKEKMEEFDAVVVVYINTMKTTFDFNF